MTKSPHKLSNSLLKSKKEKTFQEKEILDQPFLLLLSHIARRVTSLMERSNLHHDNDQQQWGEQENTMMLYQCNYDYKASLDQDPNSKNKDHHVEQSC